MAVSKAKPDEIPKDAIILTEDQAFAYQWKIIEKWENQNEIWTLRYSPGILGAFSAATGVYINNYYRNKLKLGNYGRLSTYLPIVVLPAIMSAVFHRGFIQKDIILKHKICPVCYELRSAIIQSTFGILYPALLSPFASFMFATRHYTYYVPLITENPKEFFLLWRKLSKPLGLFIGLGASGHAILSMYLTQKQIEQNYKIKQRLYEVERKVKEDFNS